MTYNKLGFAFSGIRTISFAIIDTAYKKSGETNLLTGIGFGLDKDDYAITCNARFAFEKKKDQPFLLLEIQTIFQIEENDFITKIKQDEDTFLLTKNLAVHFAVLTIGSARGILHAKTENTIFNEILLPTIDVNVMIEEDIFFKL